MRASLKFKVGLLLAAALALTVGTFTWLVVKNTRQAMLQQAVSHAAQLSETIINSTRFAMLENRPSFVDRIIGDVAAQQEIAKVRILNKNGTIIHSSDAAEIGTQVDQEAEACTACHVEVKKTGQGGAMRERPRIFTTGDGSRMLGSTAVIGNEPNCTNAACHVHSPAQSVLGILDIVAPLGQIDQAIRNSTLTIIGLSLGFVIATALLVTILVNRVVYLPLRDLEAGAGRLAAGDLEHAIPVRSQDELGQLAASFNSMTAALRKSRRELQDWGRTLEDKVQEATRELQLAQAEAARGEKLASVGLLAAGIAHELNSPLTGILTFSQLLRDQAPDGSPEAEDLDLVIKETKRCATIIRRLLDFAREKKPQKKYGDINELLVETTRLIEQTAHAEGIEIVRNLDESVPAIWIDEDLIRQVFMNLLVNAQHAIEGGGRITVRTSCCPERVAPGTTGPPEPMVEIAISDTGCGIPGENLQRIFDPFFTTKGVGKGTGLGLSVSHGTVESHGGVIEVDSTPGEGSEFRVYLPVGALEPNQQGQAV